MALRPRLTATAALCVAAALGLTAFAAPAGAAARRGPAGTTAAHRAVRHGAVRHGAAKHGATRMTVVYRNLALINGDTATVYSNGLAEVRNRTRSQVEYRTIAPTGAAAAGTAAALPGKAQLAFELAKGPAQPYAAGTLEVVLSAAARATEPARVVPAATLQRLRRSAPRPGALPAGPVPAYTTDAALNRVLAGLGTDSMSAVFPARAVQALRPQPGHLDLARAYVVHVTSATMPGAVAALSGSPAVAYASPDWTVSTTATSPI